MINLTRLSGFVRRGRAENRIHRVIHNWAPMHEHPQFGVSRKSINELLRECWAVSPGMVLRLARLFATDAEFWLNLQRAVHLYHARVATTADVTQIQPLCVP